MYVQFTKDPRTHWACILDMQNKACWREICKALPELRAHYEEEFDNEILVGAEFDEFVRSGFDMFETEAERVMWRRACDTFLSHRPRIKKYRVLCIPMGRDMCLQLKKYLAAFTLSEARRIK